jgi:hypothetical protein
LSFLDEPSTVSFGGYKKRHQVMVEQFEEIVRDGVSLIAVDPAKDNKVIGMRASHTITRYHIPNFEF